MKKILLTVLAAIFFTACGDIPVQPVQKFVDEIREDVCPDRRVNIFDVEFERQGKTVTLKGQMNSKSGLDSLVARLEREGYTVANKIQLLPDAALDGKYYGVVNRSVANIRVEPSARSEMATQAVLGVPLRIYKKQGSNYYVQTPDGYLGWIESGAFTAMTVKEFNTWRNSEKVIYLKDTGYIYKKASKDSDRIGDITATSILKVIEPKNGFVKIAYPDGRTGYIERSACDHFEVWSFSVQPKPRSIISLAKSYMGRPYLWGGTSTKMMDCSGFVRIVMMLHGIYLPRDASQQALIGKTVAEGKEEIAKLKPGDLLFFGRRRDDGSKRVTHVGIYIGNDRFIHESGTVFIQSLNPEHEDYSAYRHNQFLHAKDVINHVDNYDVQHILSNSMFFRKEINRMAGGK